MVGILIASHGGMAAGMLDTLGMVLGEQESVGSVSLSMGQDFSDFEADLARAVSALDDGDGVLILVDLLGASPCNAAQRVAHAAAADGREARVVAGMNLGMLVETALARTGMTLGELVDVARDAGRAGIDAPMPAALDDEGDDY